MDWYPSDKKQLNEFLEKVLDKKDYDKKINGIITPHAGYIYSGNIAGKAYSLLTAERVLILSPSHYLHFRGILTHSKKFWETPLGKIKIIESEFLKKEINNEHAIDNQIPFLQKIGVKEILPLMIGEINSTEAKEIAEKIKDFKGKFVVSTDLSHFYEEKTANSLDKKTIEVIENLDIKNYNKIDACGVYPLLVLIELCKIKKWKPKLIEYKTSSHVTGDFSSVVGYASFVF